MFVLKNNVIFVETSIPKYMIVQASAALSADGYTDDAITAVFINEKKNDKWAGATDSVVNVFEGGTV